MNAVATALVVVVLTLCNTFFAFQHLLLRVQDEDVRLCLQQTQTFHAINPCTLITVNNRLSLIARWTRYGFFQTVFYFGSVSQMCLAFALMCGATA